MHKIELSYALGAAGGSGIHNPLIALLQAVREHGSISGAAKALGQSYRHVWGELKRWEAQLDRTLIVWEKGQPARLTEFGDKLLWAERQAQARLAPQIAALHADLERAFAVAFDDGAHVLTLYASHDDALERLEVQVSDLDVIVTEDRRFLLMDLGFYDRGPTKAAPMTRQLQNMLGGVVRAVP